MLKLLGALNGALSLFSFPLEDLNSKDKVKNFFLKNSGKAKRERKDQIVYNLGITRFELFSY